MRITYFVCWLAFAAGVLLSGPNSAGAQGMSAEQACTPDAMRLCSEFIPDRARTAACMRARWSQLSAECRAASGGAKHGRTRGHGRGHGHVKHHHS